MAVKSVRLLHGNKLIMGHNDDILLGDGWGVLECQPPFTRRIMHRASLTLCPLGGENAITVDYFIPEKWVSPAEFHVTVGPYQFDIPFSVRGKWQTFTHILPGRVQGEVMVILELDGAWSAVKNARKRRNAAPPPGLGISRSSWRSIESSARDVMMNKGGNCYWIEIMKRIP